MFTHLHLHTNYSLLDSVIKIPDLINHLKLNNMNSAAITDHGTMAGIYDFYKQCKKNNIHSLIGCEIYCTQDKDNLSKEKMTRDNNHLIVLCKDYIGFQSLSEILSYGSLNNFYYKPRIYKENLRALGGHCVILSGCLGSSLAAKLSFTEDVYGNFSKCEDINNLVEKEIDYYLNVFEDDYYLELQIYNDPTNKQQLYNNYLLEVGNRRKIKFVVTADCHYLTKQDIEFHELAIAMQLKKTIHEYRQSANLRYGPFYYVASSEEMLERTKSINCEQAYYNTSEIVNKCNCVFPEITKFKEPFFDITKEKDYQEFLVYLKNNR